MSRQRCRNRARQHRYLLHLVALAYKMLNVSANLFKLFNLKYVEIYPPCFYLYIFFIWVYQNIFRSHFLVFSRMSLRSAE